MDNVSGKMEEFLSLYQTNITREGADKLLDWLKQSDFFKAPASTRFHGNFDGGLLVHSLNVYHCLKSLLSHLDLADKYSDETVAIVSLLHDVCKVNFYKKGTRNVKENGQWVTKEVFEMLKWLSFGNGLIRPACASFRNSVANGEFYDNGFKELNDMLAMEAGRIAMQETIMRFLVTFCGYSNAESDNVRRAIAKKKGTEKLLPEIEERFIKYSSEHYDITKERCEEVIKPFLQIILDASAYGFSWNHSDAYSAVGYICGYLRYYYPLEFLTAALNIFGDNKDKTAAITKYATRVGIKITLPKWGLSKGDYFFDRERNVIAKGLASVKFMSAGLAEELYNLAKEKPYINFMDVLYDLDHKTSINSRQLEILIQLDFFSDFGNQRELLRMVDLFNMFKKGEAKQIKKSAVDGTPLEPIVERYAVGVTKSGGVAKSYTLLDVMSILREAEAAVKAMGMDDLSDIIKVRNFYDVMGYIGYVSGKDADRPKLYITKTAPLYRKKDNVQFGYSVFTKSIGNGKESRFTVVNQIYNKEPVKEGDIIYCRGYERNGQYFKMTAYEKIY